MEDQTIEQVSEEAEDTLLGAGNVEVPEETTVQTGLTEAQIRAIMREERELMVKQSAAETAKAFRAMQSMSDKKAAQVKSDAEKQVDAMIAAGAQITPEMKASYVSAVVSKYKDSLYDEAPEPAQVQTPPENESNTLFDAAKATIQRTATKLGVNIEDVDNVELTRLFNAVNSPKAYQDFLDKAETYLTNKAKTAKTPPQARMASAVGNSGSSKPTVESYKKEVVANRGNRDAIEKIKEKYRKLGIDINQVKWSQ